MSSFLGPVGDYFSNEKSNNAFVKMGSTIEPGNLVSQGYANFQKNSMDDNCIIHFHTVLEGFAYPCDHTSGSMGHAIIR